MEIIHEIENYVIGDKPLYAALGNFDGVHKGHQQIIRNMAEKAHLNGGLAASFIFEPHPIKVLNPDKAPLMLVDKDIKAELLEKLGLDILIYNTFSKDISRCSPEEFVRDILIAKLGIREVFIGFNYSFGYRGAGTPELLQEFGKKYNFGVNIIPSVKVADLVVSSTLIRQMLDQGDIRQAHKLLGYFPVLQGIVVEGEHRGTAIGFPTANLAVDAGLQVPAKGVYAACINIGSEKYMAVVNIGMKPTFHEDFPISIEAHILNFDRNIYGQKVRISFMERIRDEMKFDGVECLIRQIGLDRDKAYKLLNDYR